MDWKSIAILFGIENPEWLNELTFRTLSEAEVRNGGNENMIRNWCFGSAQQPIAPKLSLVLRNGSSVAD